MLNKQWGAGLDYDTAPYTWHLRPYQWWSNNYWPELALSPQHEKLFSLLCVLERVATTARLRTPDLVMEALDRLHSQACLAMTDVGTHAKVSLRVRIAMEAIIARTTFNIVRHDPYSALDFVRSAAKWGSGKSKLLTAVTDQTWREQCAGRAQLALRREYPGLIFD